MHPREVRRAAIAQQRDPRPREARAERGGARRQQHALDEHVADIARAGRAERRAHRQFAPAARDARDQQVRCIRARQQPDGAAQAHDPPAVTRTSPTMYVFRSSMPHVARSSWYDVRHTGKSRLLISCSSVAAAVRSASLGSRPITARKNGPLREGTGHCAGTKKSMPCSARRFPHTLRPCACTPRRRTAGACRSRPRGRRTTAARTRD